MLRVFHASFRIRHYECDPYSHVNNANYLRYMQEAAFDASADAGFDLAKYGELGTFWLIRETGIEYLRPAGYGDTLDVKTWVSDLRRARSRREYEMTLAGSGEVAARAYTDWIYLDRQSGQPARVPPEMVAAFLPEATEGELPRIERNPFPEPPPPPLGAFTARRRVAWHYLDPAGHVNNAWYLSLMEDTAIQAAESAGWPLQRATESGFAIFARRHRIEYLRQAQMGDELSITTYLSGPRRSSATRHYLIRRGEELLARAETLWVWVDLVSGRPVHIQPEWWQDFEGQIAAG